MSKNGMSDFKLTHFSKKTPSKLRFDVQKRDDTFQVGTLFEENTFKTAIFGSDLGEVRVRTIDVVRRLRTLITCSNRIDQSWVIVVLVSVSKVQRSKNQSESNNNSKK